MMKQDEGIQQVLLLMQQLRDPEHGCPWDKEQTFDTIAPYTLEETYEVIDAIQQKNYSHLKEELGDLLFQVVFYSQMGKEQGLFDFDEVCDVLSKKLIHRHPHVFGSERVSDSKQVLADWEKRKTTERAEKSQQSVLDDIPNALPALMKAYKIQKRCASVGFDWETIEPVLDKVYEELDEVMHEARQDQVDDEKLGEELGDLLFAMVNLIRHMGYKAEDVLQKANQKFSRRFREVERYVSQSGKSLSTASLNEMEQHWQQVKREENKK